MEILTWGVLILFTFFSYQKILNLNNAEVKKIICGIAFSGMAAYGVFLLRTTMPYTRFVIMALALWIFVGVRAKTKLDLALTAITISIGICFGFGLALVSFFSAIVRIFFHSTNTVPVICLTIAVETILLKGLFKTRRLQKGMLFLKQPENGKLGIALSIVIFMTVILDLSLNPKM